MNMTHEELLSFIAENVGLGLINVTIKEDKIVLSTDVELSNVLELYQKFLI